MIIFQKMTPQTKQDFENDPQQNAPHPHPLFTRNKWAAPYMHTPTTWSFYSPEIFRTTKNVLNDLLIEDVKILPESILVEGRGSWESNFCKSFWQKKRIAEGIVNSKCTIFCKYIVM